MADEGRNELEARVSTLLQDNKAGLTVEEISQRLDVSQVYIRIVLRTLLQDGSVAGEKGVWKLAGKTTR